MGNASFIHRRMCVVLRALIHPGVRYIKTKMNQADELSELPKETNQWSSIQGRTALATWACYPSANSVNAPIAIIPAPITSASSSMSKSAVCRPLCVPGLAALPVPNRKKQPGITCV